MPEAAVLIIDGQECEDVVRRAGEMFPPSWPVCWWDGASGEDVARTLDGTKWYRRDRGGYSPSPWERIATPERQPALS